MHGRMHPNYCQITILCMCVCTCTCVYVCVRVYTIYVFVGSCLATKVCIGNMPAMGRGWVIIKYRPMMNRGQLPTKQQCLQPAGLSISVKVMQYQCFWRSISGTVDQYNIIIQCTSMFDVTLLTVCYVHGTIECKLVQCACADESSTIME